MKFEITLYRNIIRTWISEFSEYETERCEVTDNFENVRPLTDRRLRISKLDFIFVTRSFKICKLDLYGGSDLIDRF